MGKKSDIFSENDKKALHIFAKKCLHLRNQFTLDTHTLTPTNFQEEKEKFFASSTYNPHFTYHVRTASIVRKELDALKKELSLLALPNDLAQHFSQFIRSIAVLSETVKAVGTSQFPLFTQKLFPFSTTNAYKTLQSLPHITFYEDSPHTIHKAEEIAQIFSEYLHTYDALQEYNIYIDTFNDHTIRVGEKKLVIGSRVKRTTSNVNRLIVHEIESHILQRHNHRIAKNPLIKLLHVEEQELLAEGLAVFNEIYTKTITRKAYHTYFYRLKAVEMINSSFREIYNYLADFVTPHQAFIITTRVKRGMGDTSQPGGFPKDAAYLLGYNKINDYISSGGSLPFLYLVRHPEYGKLLAKYDLLTPADYVLPKFLKKKNIPEFQYEFLRN